MCYLFFLFKWQGRKWKTIDNGQKDNMYDTASITPITGYAPSAGDYLLVYLDYFLPSFGGYSGYFTVNSYNIDDVDSVTPLNAIRTEQLPVYTSPLSHIRYDLRNYLDFRPVKTNPAADATTVAAATTNPSKSTVFNYSG